MTQDARDPNGRFTPGCPAGPGRPKRQTETAYMASIGDAISLEDWQAIVRRAADDAKGGDGKAREWLAKYLIGAEPPTLVSIAATEQRAANGFEIIEDAVTREAARQRIDQRREASCRELQLISLGLLRDDG